MGTIRLTGSAKEPVGSPEGVLNPRVGSEFRFTMKSTTGDCIETTPTVVSLLPPDAAYDFTLAFGVVQVEYRPNVSVNFKKLRDVIVNADNPSTTIPELLLSSVPETPEVIQEMRDILAEANNAATQAQDAVNSIDTTQINTNTQNITANAQNIADNAKNVNDNYLAKSLLSDATDSDSSDDVATSKAVSDVREIAESNTVPVRSRYDMTAQRVAGVVYSNDEDHEIAVSVTAEKQGGGSVLLEFKIDDERVGLQSAYQNSTDTAAGTLTFVIPSSSTYSIELLTGGTLTNWQELR